MPDQHDGLDLDSKLVLMRFLRGLSEQELEYLCGATAEKLWRARSGTGSHRSRSDRARQERSSRRGNVGVSGSAKNFQRGKGA
jgi:hypothetical protein